MTPDQKPGSQLLRAGYSETVVTPPVGFNLFVLQTMSGKDSNTVALAALPFFFLLVAAVAIITIFPQIVMVLPELAFPK